MQIDAAERERRRTLLAEHYDAENEHDLKRIMATFSPGAEMRYNGRSFADPEACAVLARMANDGMAELVDRYPSRFPGFVASLPMNHPDAAEKERIVGEATDALVRAVEDQGLTVEE